MLATIVKATPMKLTMPNAHMTQPRRREHMMADHMETMMLNDTSSSCSLYRWNGNVRCVLNPHSPSATWLTISHMAQSTTRK